MVMMMMVVMTIRAPLSSTRPHHGCNCHAAFSSQAPPFCHFHPFSLAFTEPVSCGVGGEEFGELFGVGVHLNERDGDACSAIAEGAGQCIGGHACTVNAQSSQSDGAQVQRYSALDRLQTHGTKNSTELTNNWAERLLRALPKDASEGKVQRPKPSARPKTSLSTPPVPCRFIVKTSSPTRSVQTQTPAASR